MDFEIIDGGTSSLGNTSVKPEVSNVSAPINNEVNSGFDALGLYGEDLTAKSYVSNPAIAREDEIKKLLKQSEIIANALNMY